MHRVFDFSQLSVEDEAVLGDEIETNINGMFRMTAAFLPQLKAQASATIMNVSSGLAFVPMARFPVYCATKVPERGPFAAGSQGFPPDLGS